MTSFRCSSRNSRVRLLHTVYKSAKLLFRVNSTRPPSLQKSQTIRLRMFGCYVSPRIEQLTRNCGIFDVKHGTLQRCNRIVLLCVRKVNRFFVLVCFNRTGRRLNRDLKGFSNSNPMAL